MLRALLLMLTLLPLPAVAETVVADLSQDRVSISTSFDGSEILIFGAVKRVAPEPEDGPLAVIITVAGPSEPVTVRRKERRFGIWVNAASSEVDSAPSFYAVASSLPLSEALLPTENTRWQIGVGEQLGIREAGPRDGAFRAALIRVRTTEGSYVTAENSVDLRDATLFSTSVALPSALTEGTYATRIFLTRGGTVVDNFETSIEVRKVGLERLIYGLAHEQPLVYGLLSLFIAIVAGWAASAVFRYIRI